MDRFKQLGKTLRKNKDESFINTRRIQDNLPKIERKLDDLSGDQGYLLEFPLTAFNHSINLDLKVRPDNCCDCLPGAQTVKRDAIAYMTPGFPDPNWQTTNFGSVPTGEMQEAIYIEPLVQTGTNFNYGWTGPIFIPFFIPFPIFGGYLIDPTGGVIIPVDGMYSVLHRQEIALNTASDSYLITAILQNGEPISKKVYSVAKGNLELGDLHGKVYYQYAACVPLHAGDIVGAGLQSNAINWHVNGERGTPNSTRFVLIGLGFGVLVGRVYNNITGVGIAGATVSYTMGFGGSTTTDENGFYEFDELTPGQYSLTASKAGYVSMTRDIEVLFDDIVNLDFNLSPV